MTDFIQLSTTTSSADEAERIASALVEQRLAACVQIVPQVRSIYRWQGAIEKADECLCLIKTRVSLSERVTAEIDRLHSYDRPEIVGVTIEHTSASYQQWLDEQLIEC